MCIGLKYKKIQKCPRMRPKYSKFTFNILIGSGGSGYVGV